MENKKLIIANMKMNMTLDDVIDYTSNMKKYNNVIYCPTSLYAAYFIDSDYNVGLQNVSEYESGSYTGEISAKQASSLGVKYVIVGHSERRSNYQETDNIVNKKLKKVLKNNMIAILCVGETLVERKTKVEKDKIKIQLLEGLKEIDKKYYDNIFISYEPIWAIGTGRIPEQKDIISMISFIKETVNNEFNFIPRILYGGGITDKNIEQLNKISGLDGFLVGSTSLIHDKFIKLIEAVN